MKLAKRATDFIAVAALLGCSALCADAQSPTPPSASTHPSDNSDRIQRIEQNTAVISLGENKSPLKLSLRELMDKFNVPGLSIAVIDNFQIVWVKAYGVIGAGSKTPVTPKTLFQAGSISKPVTAAAALSMVEAGKLSLDQERERPAQKLESLRTTSSRKRKKSLCAA